MSKMSKKYRTTVNLDKEIQTIRKEYNINISQEINQYLKDKYMSIERLEDRRDQLEAQKRMKKKEKHRLEMDIDDIENRLYRINNKIMQNETVQRIKKNEYMKKKVDGAVSRVKEAENTEKAVMKNAEVIAENFEDFSQEEIAEVLQFFI